MICTFAYGFNQINRLMIIEAIFPLNTIKIIFTLTEVEATF